MSTRIVSFLVLFLTLPLLWNKDACCQSPALNEVPKIAIKEIIIKGNKTTREDIIHRDLAFKTGDSIPVDKMTEIFKLSERLLLNLQLFNDVTIKSDSLGVVSIRVEESWYIWPVPVLQLADRNFNEWWLTKDFSRLDYGVDLRWRNFTGRNDVFSLILNGGYTKRIELGYSLPFIDKKKRWGMGINSYYSANKEVWIYPENDKIRFFSYDNKFLISRAGVGLNFVYRMKFFNKHMFGIMYQNIEVSDTVVSQAENPYFLYQGQNSQNDIMLYYHFIHDKRDFRGYPLKGYFFKYSNNMIAYQSSEPNLSDIRIQTGARVAGFQPFPGGWYGSASLSGFVSNMLRPPYPDFRALGYRNDFVRGYEPYVVDGKDFILLRSNLRKAIVKDYKFKVTNRFLESYRTMIFSLFGGFHYDAGYVNSPFMFENNQLPNRWINGWGVGLDFVFYYNNAIRAEYSFNHFGGRNLYIHFYAPVL
jgi:hypothetical protein